MKQKKINTITRKQGFGKRCQLWIPVRTGSLSCCRLAQTKNIVIDVTLTVSKYIPHTITYHTHEQIIRTHQTNCTSINRQDNNKEPRTILWDRKNVIRSKSSRPPTTKTKRNKFDDNKMKRWEQYLVVIHRFTIVTTIKFIGLDATVEKKTTKKQKDNKTHGVGGRLLVNENKTKGVATGAESARKVGFFEGLSAGRKVSLRVRLRLATSERTNTNARQHTDTESHTDARRGGARVFRLFCLAAALLFRLSRVGARTPPCELTAYALFPSNLIWFGFVSYHCTHRDFWPRRWTRVDSSSCHRSPYGTLDAAERTRKVDRNVVGARSQRRRVHWNIVATTNCVYRRDYFRVPTAREITVCSCLLYGPFRRAQGCRIAKPGAGLPPGLARAKPAPTAFNCEISFEKSTHSDKGGETSHLINYSLSKIIFILTFFFCKDNNTFVYKW